MTRRYIGVTSRSTKKKVELSVVLPIYNDLTRLERELPPLIQYLKRLRLSWELILSDDGGADSPALHRLAESFRVRLVTHPVNQGKGAAVRRGMLAARGRYRLFTDSDVPFELETIERFLHYLRDKEFDMVVGDRTLADSEYHVRISAWRRLGSYVYAHIVSHFVAGGWYDTQCGIKGFSAEVAEDLFSAGKVNRFGFDVELFYVALMRNYDIKRCPVRLRGRTNISSHVSVVRDGLRMLFDMGLMVWRRRLGQYGKKRVRPLRAVPAASHIAKQRRSR